ncbi:hypothetical protein [Chromatocurvus halotolerans]|uniref:Uncharacterized protein n=1 Tax=Chromatocurvus halotolerans TaxID=1132028 RepID=A0A4R2L3J4_9GAMM|nr:hypothetical protein [Chromatocurvus halotolerans]TCO73695.1 hypothetical protein EV688_11511 [Chromatocurvus halotolerans]
MATQSRTTEKNPNNPETPTVKTDETPTVTLLRKSSCKSLEGKATLGYHLGTDADGALHWRLASNSGGGFFSDEWVPFQAIQNALEAWPQDKPITSMALRQLFVGRSANNPSFLLATLVAEKVLDRVPESKRHYQLGDVAGFLSVMEGSKAGHSKPAKPRAKARGKAGTGMTKAKAGTSGEK